jgi:RHS repeat-associated protein
MTYDGDLQRRQRVAGATEINFVWDREQVLMELNAAGATAARYTLAPFGYGDLVSQRRWGVSSFYHFDALGTTRRVTAADESTQLTYVRDAFGVGIASTGTTTNRFRYLGKLGYLQEDTLAGALLRRRYYQYEIGRFVSRDPLRDPGRSEYGYVGNRPTRGVDPSGEQMWPGGSPPVTWRPDPPIDVVIEPPMTLPTPAVPLWPGGRPPVTWRPDPPIDVVIEPPMPLPRLAVPPIGWRIRYENGFGVPVPIGSMPPGTYFPWPFDPKYEFDPFRRPPPDNRVFRGNPMDVWMEYYSCLGRCLYRTGEDLSAAVGGTFVTLCLGVVVQASPPYIQWPINLGLPGAIWVMCRSYCFDHVFLGATY